MEAEIVSVLWKAAITGLFAGLIGGGAIIGLFYRALTDRLRGTFATVEQLNGVGSRLNGLETVAVGAREVADAAAAAISRQEIIQQQQWERIAEHVVKPLEKISDRMDKLAEAQSSLATSVEYLQQAAKPTPRPRRRGQS